MRIQATLQPAWALLSLDSLNIRLSTHLSHLEMGILRSLTIPEPWAEASGLDAARTLARARLEPSTLLDGYLDRIA